MTKYCLVSRGWIIWDKGAGFANGPFAEAELAWTSYDRNIRIYRHDPLAKRDYNNRIHPTQKPVALYKWLLHNYAKQGDTIFDSHFGSLSIGIACHDMGFKLTACELDPDYYNAATKRLREHQQQQTLF